MDTLCPPKPPQKLSRDCSVIRLAIAGLGKMGMAHLQAVRDLQKGVTEEYYKDGLSSLLTRLRICGVCDPRVEVLDHIKGLVWYPQWTELLASQQPHVAIIASPTATHFGLASLALKTGVHTLVEKPLAPTLQECKTLIDLSRKQGCSLLAGHVERYNPVSIKLKNWLRSTGPGIRYYRFERTQPLPSRIPEDILTDKLIHDLDQALYLFGPVLETQVEQCIRVRNRIVEASVRMQHANGTGGSLRVSWLSETAMPVRTVSMLGAGRERIQGDFFAKTLQCNDEPILCSIPGWVSRHNNQLKDLLTDFMSTCMEPTAGSTSPLLTPENILEGMTLLEQIRAQAEHV